METAVNHPARGLRRLALATALLVGVIGLDQVTKYVATQTLRGQPPHSYLYDTVHLVYALNPGGFLSLGGNLSPAVRFWVFGSMNLLLLAGTVALLVVKWDMPRVCFLALTLVLAGGIGNLIDRAWQGGLVTDFLNLGIGPVRTGIFNVADMALTAGALLLVVACRQKPDEQKTN